MPITPQQLEQERIRRFGIAFEASPIGQAIIDLDGRWLVVNAAVCRIVGCSPDELVQRRFRDFTHPEDIDENLALTERLIAGEMDSYEMEKRYVRKDGQVVWVLMTASLVRDDDGEPLYIVSQIQDITDRKEAAEARARLSAVVDWSADAIMTGDAAGTILSWNRAAEKLFGYTEDEVIGKPATMLTPADRPEEPLEIIGRVRRGENVVGFETVRQHKNGEAIDVSITISGYRTGEVTGFSVITRDIREQKRAERALKRSEEELRSIVTAQQDVATAGLDRREVGSRIAERAQALTGGKGAAVSIIEGNELWRIAASGTLAHLADTRLTLDEGLARLSVDRGDIVLIDDAETDPRAEEIGLEVGGARSIALIPLFDGEGAVGVLKVVSDEPDVFVPRAIDILKIMAALMVAALRDATAYETQQRTLQEKEAYARELERSNRELQDFAYIASHDLQEPLRKVQAFGDRLRTQHATSLDAQANDYLSRMQAAAKRMQGLIQDLLAYSRVTSKAQPFERIDLRQIVREVILDLSIPAEKAEAKIDVGELPAIEADPVQMRQLFQNLLSNAIKFRRTDVPLEIVVTGATVAEAGSLVEIRVADNGIGLEAKYADQIFRPFERLHARDAYDGTGIGLAICRKIIERHDGQIHVESEPGHGTTFIFRLPARRQEKERTA